MAIDIVETYGGIVNQFVGDGLRLFGVDAAHEDDPVRAVRSCFRSSCGGTPSQRGSRLVHRRVTRHAYGDSYGTDSHERSRFTGWYLRDYW